MPNGMPKSAFTTSCMLRYRLTRYEASAMALVVTWMRPGPMSAMTRSRMLSRLRSIRMVKTMTASVIASGRATGVTKSAVASNAFAGLSLTGIGGCSGAASFSMSLMAAAALPMLLSCFGWRSAWIFLTMFCRYSGSCAPSATACEAATPTMVATTAKANSTTISVAARRGSFHCSRRRTAGASRKANRIATASGTSTSLAR